ncbi:hypothetical protein PVK06_005713 [Gossypium arboreum]|uniref:Uncharacterized protein n=1 Tax=Gossypium arboreum TaxID=29729 RepID=A0ABR0QW97_GOSAR|nr:hypothetical protein PVK06_005713 [Gossypium arboreum]
MEFSLLNEISPSLLGRFIEEAFSKTKVKEPLYCLDVLEAVVLRFGMCFFKHVKFAFKLNNGKMQWPRQFAVQKKFLYASVLECACPWKFEI